MSASDTIGGVLVVQLPDVDRQIRLAWATRDSAGYAATWARIDDLLDQRLQLQAPPPYAGRCLSCEQDAVIVPNATPYGVVRLTWCRRCDTRICSRAQGGCGTNVVDPKAQHCRECGRTLAGA